MKELKPSTRQRFVSIPFDSPSLEVESEIVAGESGCDSKTARRLAALGAKLRKLDELGLAELPSTRLLVGAGKLIVSGMDPRRACEVAVVHPEAEAPQVGAVERVVLDEQELADAVLQHTFQKIETADEHRGGSRDLDGADELDDQLEALDEVKLGKVIRTEDEVGEVCDRLGEDLAVRGFASHTRNRCLVFEIQRAGEPSRVGQARLGAVRPQGFTRIGPALRHAVRETAARRTRRSLVVLITDGRPTDYDRYEGRHCVNDVRQAVREAERQGVHVHALTVGKAERGELPSMFGPGRWDVLSRAEDLPRALAALYARMG